MALGRFMRKQYLWAEYKRGYERGLSSAARAEERAAFDLGKEDSEAGRPHGDSFEEWWEELIGEAEADEQADGDAVVDDDDDHEDDFNDDAVESF